MRPIPPIAGSAQKNRALRSVLVLICVTAFAVLVLQVSGFEPLLWWHEHQASVTASSANNPRAAPQAPIVVVQPTPRGTDSSTSTVALPLHLVATRPGRNPSEGYADIGVEVNSPQTYRAGALLVNGAILSQIHLDHVVLTREGRSATLYVEGHSQPDAAQLSAAGSILTVGGVSVAPVAQASSRDSLTEILRVTPTYDGDRLLGLQVYPAGHVPEFEALGLQPGDRLSAIDGVPITSVAAALETLRQITRGQAVVVQLERSGRTVSLSLDGAVLHSPAIADTRTGS